MNYREESLNVRVFNSCSKLICGVLLTLVHASSCQYIPVAVLLNQQEDHIEIDLSSSLDPIMSELILHLDQQYAPVLVSRQLVHALIRTRDTATQEVAHPNTRLFKLDQLLKQYVNAHNPFQHMELQSRYREEPTLPSASPAQEQFPNLYQDIQTHLKEQKSCLMYLFLTQLRLDAWRIFSLLKSDGSNTVPLYLLVPSAQDATLERSMMNDTQHFRHTRLDELTNLARSESTANQQRDTQYHTSARRICNTLSALRSHIQHPESTSTFIISLGGHGQYTRSAYGVLSDHLKPTNHIDLSKINQTAQEPKDSLNCIGALSLREFQKLLSLLNKQLPTSFFYYDSCYTGNNHLILPYTKKNGTPKTFDFAIATASADSEVSHRDPVELEIEHNGPVKIFMKCPMNPKKFFENCMRWLELKSCPHQIHEMLLPMLGAQRTVACMVRTRGAKTFTPQLDPQHVEVSPERSRNLSEIIIQEADSHLFLRHNLLKPTICGYVPSIRSLIPTNSTHYINRIACIDLKQRSLLQIFEHMFFHAHHRYAMNRMVFFIKQLKLTSNGTTHSLRDVFAVHHRYTDSLRNNIVIWRTAKKNKFTKPVFSLARQSPEGHLEEDHTKEFKRKWAYETILQYLSLGTQQQSYIEAPPLSIALPEAYDDSAIQTLCATACMDRAYRGKHIAGIWKLLGL